MCLLFPPLPPKKVHLDYIYWSFPFWHTADWKYFLLKNNSCGLRLKWPRHCTEHFAYNNSSFHPHISLVKSELLSLRKMSLGVQVTHLRSSCLSFPCIVVKVTQSCPTLWDPVGYTVYGILQARILEWVAFPFSRGSSQPRDRIQVSHIAGGFLISWATREAQEYWSG